MVVAVTGKTTFRLYLRRNMISFVLPDPLFQFLMAGEAFFIGHLLTQLMAFGAIGQTLQVCMRGSQRTRGELRPGSRARQPEPKEDYMK